MAKGSAGGPTSPQIALIVLVLVLVVGALVVQYQRRQHVTALPPPAILPSPAQVETPTPAAAKSSPERGPSVGTVNLLLGNPSNATADASNRDNYLMAKPYYTLSYNDLTGTPNWVSWRVVREDLGDAPRKQLFDTDTTLPPGFKRVTHKDYSGSGFDRGHMCPKGDRDSSGESSNGTFVMTNIIPQAPNVNEKAWAELEDYCRSLVTKKKATLYVVAGPWGDGGTGSGGMKNTIGRGKVTVPADCWKVVVVADGSGGVSAGDDVIAVVMPNDQAQVTTTNWRKYRTKVADVEAKTGLKFFTALPAETADALRKKGK